MTLPLLNPSCMDALAKARFHSWCCSERWQRLHSSHPPQRLGPCWPPPPLFEILVKTCPTTKPCCYTSIHVNRRQSQRTKALNKINKEGKKKQAPMMMMKVDLQTAVVHPFPFGASRTAVIQSTPLLNGCLKRGEANKQTCKAHLFTTISA